MATVKHYLCTHAHTLMHTNAEKIINSGSFLYPRMLEESLNLRSAFKGQIYHFPEMITD